MGVASFEREMWIELMEVVENKKIRLKDIMEWRTTKFEGLDEEKVMFLPRNGVWVAYVEVI